jgi:hypothetical protein
VFAPAAHGAVIEVTNTTDNDPGSLRDAINQANVAASGDDEIVFQDGLTGLIRLTTGELPINPATAGERLTITGPGAANLSISGDANDNGPGPGDSRILNVAAASGAVRVSGLTLTEGRVAAASGGAVFNAAADGLTIANSVVSSSTADQGGGGIAGTGQLTVTGSTLSGNTATGTTSGGAIFLTGPGALTITDSDITGNSAASAGAVRHTASSTTIDGSTIEGNHAIAGSGGGIAATGPLTLTNSTVSGNTATAMGGGLYGSDDYEFRVTGSTITGNSAPSGGGVAVSAPDDKYAGHSVLARTTISGNHATAGPGGGIHLNAVEDDDRLAVTQSTISGNDATTAGGGISFAAIRGDVRVTTSTISGNSAPRGGGVAAGSQPEARVVGSKGAIAFDNSTVAANTATDSGGGFYLSQYDSPADPAVKTSVTLKLTSTLVADNTAGAAPNDADRVDTSTGGGLDLAFSLVEAPGDAPLFQSATHPSIVGTDPQLGALLANGGPTLTHAPATASPAVDKGFAPARPDVDQRGLTRTVDGSGVDNPVRGDGSDIGAVELQNPPVKPPDEPPPPEDLAPRAVVGKNKLAAKKTRNRVVRGTATDDNGVVRVEVAVVRKRNGRCASMRANGRFRRSTRCDVDPRFLAAQGTANWRFRARRRLKKGNYIVYARAVDTAGQVQSSFGAASVDPFRVGR